MLPYITITKEDNAMFKVYVDGSRSDIKSFFQEATCELGNSNDLQLERPLDVRSHQTINICNFKVLK